MAAPLRTMGQNFLIWRSQGGENTHELQGLGSTRIAVNELLLARKEQAK
jgi:hypothetical protein